MKILAFVPTSRNITCSLQSISDLQRGGHHVDFWFAGRELSDDPDRYERITAKLQYGRGVFLGGDWDALMLIDDDQIIPEDALVRLGDVDADVVYGLTVLRNQPEIWSAQLYIEGDHLYETLSSDPVEARKCWGRTIDVMGCGTFCTLIRRRALEELWFWRDGPHCCDWTFAKECNEHGFSQKADLGVVCGHVDDEVGVVYWPDPETMYRVEKLEQIL